MEQQKPLGSVDWIATSSCINDDTLGPFVRGCRDDFDFTLLFEHVVLTIVPAAIFVVAASARFLHLLGKKKVATAPKFQWLKLLVLAVYAGIRLRQLVLTSYGTTWTSTTALVSDAFSFVVGIGMIPLSFLEHGRSPRPSILLGIFLTATLLFDIAQTRTQSLSQETHHDNQQLCLSAAAIVVKVVSLVVESHQTPKASYSAEKERSPEATSGIISLTTFFWLNGLFAKGYRKVLAIDDLFLLDDAMSAETLYAKFEPHVGNDIRLGRPHALIWGLLRTLAVPFLLPVIPRLCRMGFSFCQPLMIESLLKYLQEPEGVSSPSKGYGFIGVAVLIYTGMAVSQSTYYYLHERFLYMTRGILASAVYRSTLALQLSAADDSAALTLMNADVERVRGGFINLHEYWANLIEIGIACWLLYRQIGPAFLAPVAIVVICAALSTFNGKHTGPRQMAWMKAIQKRVGVTSKVISNMKALKISALSGPIENLILGLRLQELKLGGRWRTMVVASVSISFTSTLLGPVVAFAATSSTLDVTRIFTSMAYLMLLASPLAYLLQTIPMLMSSLACLGRIQAYLQKDARVDSRTTPGALTKTHNDAIADSEAVAIAVKHGSFGWEKGKNVMNDIDLSIPASSLTIIVGPIASGKSTLLKAFLGETPFNSGDVVFGVNYRRIGYCDQSPFLYNDTVKANIIGHSGFDAARYEEVIEATMLSADLAILPRGDSTKVGSNGVTLSGGQRQRVALARALYLDTDILIFDDILSGLDANTEEHVFRRVFGSNGIVRQRGVTAVLCTHSVRHLPSADHIVALGTDCTVVEEGPFSKLQANGKYVQSLKIREAEEAAHEPNGSNNEPKPAALAQSKAVGSDPDETKNKARQMGDLAVYKHYFSSISVWAIAAFLFFCFSYSFCGSFPVVWLKIWAEDIASTDPKRSKVFYLGIYAMIQVYCLFCLTMMVFVCLRWIVHQSGEAMHKKALRTLIGAPLKFFTETDTGTTTSLFAQDISFIDGELPFAFINLSVTSFGCLGMIAVIGTASPWLVVTYPFLVVVLLAIQMFYLRTSRQLRLLDLEAKSPLYSHFIDTLKGLATLRAMGFIAEDIAVNNRLLDTSQRPAYQLALIQRWLGFTLKLLVAVIATLVVTLATQLRSSSGFTGASLLTLMSFSDTLTTVVSSYTQVETSIGAVARLRTFSSTVTPESGPDEDVIPGENWPEKGAIEIKAVSASYGASKSSAALGKPSPETDLALRDVSLSFRPGETVAICGRTGSGKSSLVLLLLRLLEPVPGSPGEIIIDSLPADKIDRDVLRRRIIAVSQDPIFLPDGSTVIENLDPFGEAEEAECRSALERVGLLRAIEEKGGLAAALAADTLSAGQKQLLCLARAVVRRRVRGQKGAGGGILLLDEVSSSVDRATEVEMHNIIHEEFNGYTVVMVSHRLDTVMDCNTIVVMDKGSVAEKGKPQDLKEKEGGMFRELWNSSKGSKE
ncbi:ABC transporter [Colletotrichum plurivorum]|uniref:ABC transporter n=1 Tax=Colletotrichum plurivorum TaxID=2175906 RepID=A0A8H6KFP9_9PEZI|nr:ABC transporter [Colletotrichum plurivorum]